MLGWVSPTIGAMPATPSLGLRLQRLFLTGVLTLLPIWLTWIVVAFVFKLLSGLSRPLVDPLLASASALQPRALAWLQDPWVQTALALVATLAVILLTGDGTVDMFRRAF